MGLRSFFARGMSATFVIGALGATSGAQGLQQTIWSNPISGTSNQGNSLANVGDMNSDGIGDIAVADFNFPNANGSFGRVQILDGVGGGVLATVSTPLNSKSFGTSLGRLEDGGLIVGDLFWGQTGTTPARGAVFVYKNFDWVTPVFFDQGTSPTEGFASVVSDDLGDVNGDGVNDWAHGINGDVRVWNGIPNTGLIYTVPNPYAVVVLQQIVGLGNVDTSDPRPEFAMRHGVYVYIVRGQNGTIYKSPIPGQYHRDVASVGDVTGDSAADYITSTDGTIPNLLETKVAIWAGDSTSFLPIWEAARPAAEGFGVQVAGVSDVNSDGIDDVIVGAYDYSSASQTAPGYANILSGADGVQLALYTYPGASPLSFGRGVISPGDIDGDGNGDVVVFGLSSAGAGGTTTALRGGTVGSLVAGINAVCHCFVGPCGNSAGTSGGVVGCINSTTAGARLDAYGTASVTADDLFFVGSDLPANKLALVMYSGSSFFGGLPTLDGVLCLGGGATPVLRFQSTVLTDAGGVAVVGPGLAGAGTYDPTHSSIGSTIHFQLFYRDVIHGACSTRGNFSNGIFFPTLP